MEDDDEFGDLYTDVLQSFPSSSSSSALQQSLPPPRSEPVPPAIETAAASNAAALRSDDDDDTTLCAPSTSTLKFNINLNANPSNQTYEADFNLPRVSQDPAVPGTHGFGGVSSDSPLDSPQSEVSKARVLERGDFNLNTEPVAAEDEVDTEFDASVASKDDNWGGRVEQGDDSPVIPGISVPQPEDGDVFAQQGIRAQGEDDSDSDSEDDLQIVLNDDHQPHLHHHQGPMIGDGNFGNDDDDEDEDGDPLVIVSDTDAVHHPPPEEQGWGEDAGQAPDGERKEAGEAGKANGGVPLPPKIGYGNYGYHPFHSQFKYVRPGATPLPGGPGGPGQVRPPANVGVGGGRGRGDWKQPGMKGPSLQKGFHSGGWGNNGSGRGFGGDFTLPPQKTIFDVDIDSIEEKPWKYPGNDGTDYFNFGLDEDSWKDYCKQLERLRMESTMKNKAYVHVVGSHPEQEYDPDLPPELAAAAAGNQIPSAGNSNLQKADVGQSDIAKGTAYMRPPMQTGRPIQVEVGFSERLPSSDTRPPRMRDLDTVIEIVLQDSHDDDSPADCEALDRRDNDVSREDIREDASEEDGEQIENEYSDGSPQSLERRKRDDNVRRLPRPNARHGNVPEEDSSLHPEASVGHLSGSRANSPMDSSDKFEVSYDERQRKVKAHEKSHSTPPGEGEKSVDDKQEESYESMESKDSRDALSLEERVVSDDEPFQTKENFRKEKEGVNSSAVVSSSTLNTSKGRSMRKLKLDSQAEPGATNEIDDVGYLKAARSSDNSRATGSSRDNQKGHTVVDEEVIQDEYSSRARDLKRNRGEDAQCRHKKDHDGSMGTEKNSMMVKRREGSYPHRDWDPHSSRGSHVKSEGFDKRKERDYADGMLQQRGEDPHGRKFRAEDSRKHEHPDEMISRHRGKVREGEMSNKDEHLPSRKLLENDNWRGRHEKDAGLHYREKDDTLKTRYENVDDPYSKRRNDDEHARRDHFGKDEILQAHRESSRRKRERDESLDQRKRDEQHRRENTDDHRPSIRPKDEGWLQRERVERHRERDDRSRSKQPYEDSLPRREREDGRAAIRSGRNVEDKGWMGYERDMGRNGDPHKRRERVENASSLQVRGSDNARKDQVGHDEKRSRQEKSTVRSDRAVHVTDNRRVHERRPKENSRKGKEFEGGQQNTSSSSKKPQEERSSRIEMAGVIGTSEKGNAGRGISDQLHPTREKLEDASSDDEQHASKRGRSKLERWASHKERDFIGNAKPSSSLKSAAEKENNLGAGHSTKVVDEPAKKSEAVDRSRSPVEGKDSEVKGGEVKPVEIKHLDTVAKLKKRSERFKLPMPSEKDPSTIKKLESEPLPSAPSDAPVNSEIKQERPPRKRRWTSN